MSRPIKTVKGIELYRDGTILLIRCPHCDRENYAPAVASGMCVWCGYSALSNPDIKKKYDSLNLKHESDADKTGE